MSFIDFADDSLQNSIMEKEKNGSIGKLIPALAAMLVLGVAVGLDADQGNSEVLTKLRLDPAAAREGVVDSLANGTVYNEAAFKVFKSLPGAARDTVVRAGLAWIKSYVSGAEFKAAYAERRERMKPEAPAPRPAADDEMKRMKAEMEKNIAEMRKNLAAMNAEMKRTMEESIKAMRAQMEAMEKDPQQRDLMRQMTEMAVAEDKKRHGDRLREWDQRYPADPRVLIRKRIGDFLAASADVDYSAKLVSRGDKMVFANGAYEGKSAEWKLCYRAGKEATDAARAFARAWLAELDKI